jgi:hypothetical protein
MLKSQLSTLFILLITMVSAQSNGTLTGQVIDNKTLLPLEGATVLIEGTSIGVITGTDGYFSIQDVTPQTYSIVASFLGYTSETKFNVIVKSVGTADLLFKLEEDNQILDEVVVVKSSFRTTKETPLSTQSLSAVEIETYPGGNNDWNLPFHWRI